MTRPIPLTEDIGSEIPSDDLIIVVENDSELGTREYGNVKADILRDLPAGVGRVTLSQVGSELTVPLDGLVTATDIPVANLYDSFLIEVDAADSDAGDGRTSLDNDRARMSGIVTKTDVLTDLGYRFALQGNGAAAVILSQSSSGQLTAYGDSFNRLSDVKIKAYNIIARGEKGDTGEGVPVGGTDGQILAKSADTDYATEWIDAPSGGGSQRTLATSVSPAADDNTGAVGTSTSVARQDHKHPKQTIVDADIPASIARDSEIPDPANGVSPAANNVMGAVGTNARYARQDHRHPKQVITDADIPASIARDSEIPNASTATPQSPGNATVGSSNDYARGDHVHPKPTLVDADIPASIARDSELPTEYVDDVTLSGSSLTVSRTGAADRTITLPNAGTGGTVVSAHTPAEGDTELAGIDIAGTDYEITDAAARAGLAHDDNVITELLARTADLKAGSSSTTWAIAAADGGQGGIAVFSTLPDTTLTIRNANYSAQESAAGSERHIVIRRPNSVPASRLRIEYTTNGRAHEISLSSLVPTSIIGDSSNTYYEIGYAIHADTSVELQYSDGTTHVGVTEFEGALSTSEVREALGPYVSDVSLTGRTLAIARGLTTPASFLEIPKPTLVDADIPASIARDSELPSEYVDDVSLSGTTMTVSRIGAADRTLTLPSGDGIPAPVQTQTITTANMTSPNQDIVVGATRDIAVSAVAGSPVTKHSTNDTLVIPRGVWTLAGDIPVGSASDRTGPTFDVHGSNVNVIARSNPYLRDVDVTSGNPTFYAPRSITIEVTADTTEVTLRVLNQATLLSSTSSLSPQPLRVTANPIQNFRVWAVGGAKGDDGVDGEGVPVGGTDGQILAKSADTNYATEWIDAPSGGGRMQIHTPLPVGAAQQWASTAPDVQGFPTSYPNLWDISQGSGNSLGSILSTITDPQIGDLAVFAVTAKPRDQALNVGYGWQLYVMVRAPGGGGWRQITNASISLRSYDGGFAEGGADAGDLIRLWNAADSYPTASIVWHDSTLWTSNTDTTAGNEPGVSNNWDRVIPEITPVSNITADHTRAAGLDINIGGVTDHIAFWPFEFWGPERDFQDLDLILVNHRIFQALRDFTSRNNEAPFQTFDEQVDWHIRLNDIREISADHNRGDWDHRDTYMRGDIVWQRNHFFICRTNLLSSQTGPIGDFTNWDPIPSYRGAWSATEYYAPGDSCSDNGHLYTSLTSISPTTTTPADNASWLRIDNDTTAEIVTALSSLTGDSRLPATAIRDLPSSSNVLSTRASNGVRQIRAGSGDWLTLPAANSTADGVLGRADKEKLDTITAGAQPNNPSQTLIAGVQNPNSVADATSILTLSAGGGTAILAHASATRPGQMSRSDKAKLDAVELLANRGAWAAASLYSVGDIVRALNNQTGVAVVSVCRAAHVANISNQPTMTDSNEWRVLSVIRHQTIASVVDGIEALSGQSRLNYNQLRNKPNVNGWALNNEEWIVGEWALQQNYLRGQGVTFRGHVFTADSDHYSTSDNGPIGTNSEWTSRVELHVEASSLGLPLGAFTSPHSADDVTTLSRKGWLYWRGAWASTNHYYLQNVVRHGSNSWVCVVEHTASESETPSTTATKWALFA